ncbi:MAG: outer membrane protein [Saprospiraceae bacterium]|jgi:outer membrane protein
MGLTETISMAQKDAPDVQISKTKLSNRYWFYQSYLSDYKPQVDFNATLPNVNRSIQSIILPNGTQAFVPRSFMENSVGISLRQEVALTGGQIFASTGLERLDIFKTNLTGKSSSYLSNPIFIGFQQPLFGFNQLKWNKEIEPLRYEEANREHVEEMETVAFGTSNLFFDVLISQLNVEALIKNKDNADTLFAISTGRFSVGRIAETELLQTELSAMNADADLATARLSFQTNTERLRNFLGIEKAVIFDLIPPTEIPAFLIDEIRALQYAEKYRSASIAFRRRLKEAEREVSRAKSESGFQADIRGQFGLSQTAVELNDAYKDPLDQERFSISLSIPIADWGKAKALLEVAKSNQDLERMNVTQDRINFEREITIKVQQFDLLRTQVALAKRAYDVSEKRLDITRKRYLIGKIEIIELNLALRDQDSGRRSYYSALRAFWTAYYELRRLTLYDFEKDQPLVR